MSRKVARSIRTCAPSRSSTGTDARGGDNAAAAEIIRDQSALEFLPLSLGNRKSYARAASSGLSVVELRPADQKAVQEMESLFAVLGRRKRKRR